MFVQFVRKTPKHDNENFEFAVGDTVAHEWLLGEVLSRSRLRRMSGQPGPSVYRVFILSDEFYSEVRYVMGDALSLQQSNPAFPPAQELALAA